MSIDLTNDQIYLLHDLEHWFKKGSTQKFEISGAPGTGKSTIINYFIERMDLTKEDVMFMCYMGKACARLVQNGIPAKTIHSSIYRAKRVKKRDENGKIILDKYDKPIYTYKFELRDNLPKNVKLIVIDEASMVPESIAEDILSFEIPVITLGDLNQLPPVFGKSYFLQSPDYVLHEIMRQKEGDPIIYLSQEVLKGSNLEYGLYGKSAVIRKEDMNAFLFKTSEAILTGTNVLRHNINDYMRTKIYNFDQLDRPHVGEKLLCCKNNWNDSIDGEIFLMNGMTGIVKRVYHSKATASNMVIDFQPDFSKKYFKYIKFNYKHLNDPMNVSPSLHDNVMEYGYAITTHRAQGSEWGKVLYIHEDFLRDREQRKRLMYTAITRARESITIVK